MKIKWIDVKEKLPPGKGADQCIVCNEVNGTRLVLCAVWNGIDKVFYMIEEYGAFVEDEERVPTVIEHVSYWCELPNPPTAKRAEAQNTSTNSVSPKLPTLEETRNGIVAAGICSNFGLDTNAFGDGIRAAHDFISRQLRA